MRGVLTGRWSNPFSESSVEEKVCAAGPHEAFSDSSKEGLCAGHGREVRKASCLAVSLSNIGGLDVFLDFSNEGDSGQKMGIGGNEVFSDSEIEAENEELTGGRTGYSSAVGALFPFSDSDIEADNEVILSDSTTGALFLFFDSESEADNGEVTAAGLWDISSSSAAVATFPFLDSEEFSDSENEDDSEEVSPAVPGCFTAASFTKPIPESWLRDASDTEWIVYPSLILTRKGRLLYVRN